MISSPFESEKVPMKNPSDGCTCPLSRSQFILGGGFPLATHFRDIANPGCRVSSPKVSSNSGDTAEIIICKVGRCRREHFIFSIVYGSNVYRVEDFFSTFYKFFSFLARTGGT